MRQEQSELLQLQTSARKERSSNSGDKIIERKQYGETVIWIIGKEGEYFATIGKYKLSNSYETMDEVEEMLDGTDWHSVINAIAIMIDIMAGKKE